MKPIAYNCDTCSALLIAEPKRTTDNAGEEIYTLLANCDACLKKEPMLEMFIRIVPVEYNISEAMDANVREGNMTRRWIAAKKDWGYSLTAKGKARAEELFGAGGRG